MYKETRIVFAKKLVIDAAKIIKKGDHGALEFELKNGHQDIVTICDKRIEEYLRKCIEEKYFDDEIVGEEDFVKDGSSGYTWFIDPIDGTTNFVNQHCNYAISLACYKGLTPLCGFIYSIAEAQLFWAVKGEGAFLNGKGIKTALHRKQINQMILVTPVFQHLLLDQHPHKDSFCNLARDVRAIRSVGSIALELCMIASGRADIFIGMKSNSWDHNAARIIVEEAGGVICNLSGEVLPIRNESSVVACSSRENLEHLLKNYL